MARLASVVSWVAAAARVVTLGGGTPSDGDMAVTCAAPKPDERRVASWIFDRVAPPQGLRCGDTTWVPPTIVVCRRVDAAEGF